MDQKHSSFPSLTRTCNSRCDTAAVCISVSEEDTRKATGKVNAPLEWWGCKNYPRYHVERFHTYRNCPNKRYPDVAERAKQPIQEYDQRTSMTGGIMDAQDSQGQWITTSSMTVGSISSEKRVQITTYWKEEWFVSIEHTLLMGEMMDPSISRSVRLACAGYLKGKYEI